MVVPPADKEEKKQRQPKSSSSEPGVSALPVDWKVESTKLLMDRAYAQSFQRAEQYRARAQTAFGVATGAAAALGVAAVLSGFFASPSSLSTVVRVLVTSAVGAWGGAALFAMYATSFSTSSTPQPEAGTVVKPEDFGLHVAQSLDMEQTVLRHRTNRSLVVLASAVVMSIAVLGASLFTGQPSRTESVTIALTPEGVETVDSLCDNEISSLSAEVEADELDNERVELKVPADVCVDQHAVTVDLPREDLAGVIWLHN